MKKFISLFLTLCMIVCVCPAVFAAQYDGLKNVGMQVIPCTLIDGFEESYEGYETSIDYFEGKQVRIIKRTGADKTSHRFNMYRWAPLKDKDGNFIPLETANYIVIDYYYHSPDEEPALEGNRMGWVQGFVVPETDVADRQSFGWGNEMKSTEMTANKWDKLVISIADNESAAKTKEKFRKKGPYFLHQIKLFPLERDMGKDDVLYIGDITIQSFDPNGKSGFENRTFRFYNSEDDKEKKTAAHEKKALDLEYIKIPEFSGKAPENSVFTGWLNLYDGKKYFPGESLQALSGCNVDFTAVYEYCPDFSKLENAYINGYEDGTFKPQNQITRAEACKILASLVDPEGEKSCEVSFSDVSQNDWFYSSVATLEEMGALDIWKDKLEPNTAIKRHELVELVYAVAGYSAESKKMLFLSDVYPDDRYYDAVMFGVSSGIITGYEDGTFKPKNNITRAEAVTVFNRLIGRAYNETAASPKFSDIETHWAKGQIIAAASSKSDNLWTLKEKATFALTGNRAKDYVVSLYNQSKDLSGDAVRDGIDRVADKMKEDILNTPNTEEFYEDRMTGTRWYVSEKNGNDENDGRSPLSPVKTIAGLNKKMRFPQPGTSVLFERGGVYRGQVNVTSGFIYGSYGEGEKPVISGSLKNYADPALWEETDVKNVYRMTESITNVGIIVFDHGMYDHGNYDGLYGQPRIYGKNISEYSSLLKDLEFYSSPDTLYLKSDKGNPGERFSSIEIGNKTDIFDGNARDIIIDNLSIKHTGAHGIGLGSSYNVTVTNCEFSWLGGSLLGKHGETTTQYGNAVEIYGNCDGYYVKHNWMYQIYDTAVTHQGNDYSMENIEYSENLMEYCHWGIECWIKPVSGSPSLNHYVSRYNVLRNGGYGWGSIVTNRQDSARLYSFSMVDAQNSDMLCEYTVIDRCSGYLLDIDKRSSEIFRSNIYVQDEGYTLGGLKGKATAATKDSARLIYDNLGDKNQVFVLIPKH